MLSKFKVTFHMVSGRKQKVVVKQRGNITAEQFSDQLAQDIKESWDAGYFMTSLVYNGGKKKTTTLMKSQIESYTVKKVR